MFQLSSNIHQYSTICYLEKNANNLTTCCGFIQVCLSCEYLKEGIIHLYFQHLSKAMACLKGLFENKPCLRPLAAKVSYSYNQHCFSAYQELLAPKYIYISIIPFYHLQLLDWFRNKSIIYRIVPSSFNNQCLKFISC